jgi:hypothetical protein
VTSQIRSLNSDELLSETTVDVRREEVYAIDTNRDYNSSISFQPDDEFVLAMSISATLMEVMVGSTLIKLAVRIEASGPQIQSTKHDLQFLRNTSSSNVPALRCGS